jgi:anthranilate phosphoribosyltransferase
MTSLLQHELKRITQHGETLTRAEASQLLSTILATLPPESTPERIQFDLQLAALLGALAARGETADEIAGFVEVLRSQVTPIPLSDSEQALLVDTCGTGGDNAGTFNISTAAALVAAAAGATVAKHGNRAVSSQCGSADVLEALGIPIGLNPTEAAASLREHRFAYLHAPSLHPASKAAMPVRRAIGIRTIFNILGPLTNPAGAPAQVIGVHSKRLVPIIAEALALLGTRHAMVVHGTNQRPGFYNSNDRRQNLDELSISGYSTTAEVKDGNVEVKEHFVHTELGIPDAPLSALQGGDAQANADILRNIFSGQPGPPRDVVVVNASAVLVVAGLAENFLAAARLAEHTIDSGSVTRLVAALSA